MVSRIALSGVATFTDSSKAIIAPKKVNYFFGGNGSGKTTISQAIVDEPGMVAWDSEVLQALVYNRHFVRNNFAETNPIKGVFTLGQDNKETEEAIAALRIQAEQVMREITTCARSKEQLENERTQLNEQITESCWSVRGQFSDEFSEVLKRTRKTKAAWLEKCLEEAKKDQTALPDRKTVKRMYDFAFSVARSEYPEYSLIDIDSVERQEVCNLLQQRITGSSDSPIGKMIEYLRNSDWIKLGLAYIEKADGKCPFCQQRIPTDIEENIRAFFDEAYERDIAQLSAFFNDYSFWAKNILSRLQNYLNTPLDQILNYEQFSTELTTLETMIQNNIGTLQRKIVAPSETINISSLRPVLERFNSILLKFNNQIKNYNEIVLDQENKQQECIEIVWQLMISQLRMQIDSYKRDSSGKAKAIGSIKRKTDELSDKLNGINADVQSKERTLTTAKPTSDAINELLSKYGFEGFRVTPNPSNDKTYVIVRPDGKDAQKTLSEGEYNFITFLYFYHLVYGSQTQTGIDKPRIVVIDDPISSLDSNVLFIVSTLVKKIRDDCRKNLHGIRQVFILTHNVYFHKEATYIGNRDKWKDEEVAFWLVQKCNNTSQIVSHGRENPIKSSYELLWNELKNAHNSQSVTIFNAMRRILEHYFNLIGGLDYDKCIDEFDGTDKLVCKSLVSCINEGSHLIGDDYHIPPDNESINNYLRVFELIFDKMGHNSHYEMMIKRTS